MPVGGNCGSGGGNLVAGERNGRWRKAEEVPGLAALNTGGNAQVVSVSCPSAGHCTAAGTYKVSDSVLFMAFVTGPK